MNESILNQKIGSSAVALTSETIDHLRSVLTHPRWVQKSGQAPYWTRNQSSAVHFERSSRDGADGADPQSGIAFWRERRAEDRAIASDAKSNTSIGHKTALDRVTDHDAIDSLGAVSVWIPDSVILDSLPSIIGSLSKSPQSASVARDALRAVAQQSAQSDEATLYSALVALVRRYLNSDDGATRIALGASLPALIGGAQNVDTLGAMRETLTGAIESAPDWARDTLTGAVALIPEVTETETDGASDAPAETDPDPQSETDPQSDGASDPDPQSETDPDGASEAPTENAKQRKARLRRERRAASA